MTARQVATEVYRPYAGAHQAADDDATGAEPVADQPERVARTVTFSQ